MGVRRLQCLEWHLVGKASKRITSGTGANDQGEKRLSGMSGASTGGSFSAENGTEAEVNDLKDFCATSDRLAGWVKWSVLSLEGTPKRAEAIEVWIRVAEVSYTYTMWSVRELMVLLMPNPSINQTCSEMPTLE